jgi:hypothetical protein
MQNNTTENQRFTVSELLYPPVPAVQFNRGQALRKWPGLKTLFELCTLLTERSSNEEPLRCFLINPSQMVAEKIDFERGAVLVVNLPGQYEPLLTQLVVETPDLSFCYGINSKFGEYSAIWSVRLADAKWEVRIRTPVLEKLIVINRGTSNCARTWVPVIFVAGNSLCAGGFWAGDWNEWVYSEGTYIVDDREDIGAPSLSENVDVSAFPWRWNLWTSAFGTRAIHAEVVDWYHAPEPTTDDETENGDCLPAIPLMQRCAEDDDMPIF